MIDYGKESLNDLVARLRRRLPDYLKERGILGPDWDPEKSNRIKCLSPAHEDKNPSMEFLKSSENSRLFCFSCGASADIFQAAVWLEGLPVSGREWIKETVYHLAEMLEEEYQEVEPSDEDLDRARVLSLLSDAADVLKGLTKTKPEVGYQHTRPRGLSDEICFDMGVGTVDYENFVETLSRYGGWGKPFMEANGITQDAFGLEHITITLKDHRGVVVGFDRRFVYYSGDEEKACRKLGRHYPKKYMAPQKSSIYVPEVFLYGLDRAKTENWKTLEIFEGYFSVLAARQAGHTHCVAACGTQKIGEKHITLLQTIGFRDVCLVMDSDDAGRAAIVKYVDELKEFNGLRFSFRVLGFREEDKLADKDKDPDTFFRLYCKKSLDPYEKTPVLSLFRMSLELETRNGKGGESLARAQVVHIANEADPIQRGKMVAELAGRTGIHEEDIRASVDVVLDKRSKKIVRDLVRTLDDISLTPKEVATMLGRTQSKLSSMLNGGSDDLTENAAKALFHETMDRLHSKQGVIAGARTGIPYFDKKMGGYPSSAFITIAASMNSGKSAMMHWVVNALLKHHMENKDLAIAFFSFDDSSDWSYAKQLALQSGLPITWCANPTEHVFPFPDRARRFKDAVAFYQDAVGSRFRLFGGSKGMTMTQINSGVRNFQDDTGKRTLIVVDSFNKIQSAEGLSGTPMFERHADQLHEFVHYGQGVLVSAEITKAAMGFKPTPKDTKDCGKLLFNASINIILYNPLNDLRDKSKFFWVAEEIDQPGEYKKLPVIDAEIWKNRVGDYKGADIFKLDAFVGSFEEIPDIKPFMREHKELWRLHGKQEGISGPALMPPGSPFTGTDAPELDI